MDALRAQFDVANVAAVFLINGTFCGDDPHGLWASLDARLPGFTHRKRKKITRIVDAVAGEAGNFLDSYARLMQRGLCDNLDRGPDVERLCWSGENHHLGRATGALQIIDRLLQHDWQTDQRVLFLAQSHGGNVLALTSSLLSGDREWREKFFAAGEVFAQTGSTRAAHPVWRRVRERLSSGELPFRPEQLDVVTLGTPWMYPFHPSGYGQLLHVVNHRPCADRPRDRTRVPWSLTKLAAGADGDYVHQIGVMGSNFAPLLCCWRQSVANSRLCDLLDGRRAWRGYFQRLRAGVRVRGDGPTRLIDYGVAKKRRLHHVLGHGVYTHRRHMIPQLEQIAAAMYDAP